MSTPSVVWGKQSIVAICLAGACSISAAAQGQAMLEEILVTATKREAGLQDIAVTVDAFSEQTIQQAGIQNARDLSVLTPSLSVVTNTNPFTVNMRIRGVGTSQSDPALEPSVGVFVDGVYVGRSGLGMSDLTDIERIEVLQGPQGTLYGKNTNAGAISIITKQPNMEELEGFVEATAGDYNMRRVTASVSGPMAESLAYRLAGSVHQRDGYLENGGGEDLNGADDWNLQGKLLYLPSDTVSILLSGSHVDRDTKCCGADARQSEEVNEELARQGFQVPANDPKDYKIAVDQDSDFTLDSDSLSLVVDFEMSWASLKSITAWNDYDYSSSTDADRSELDVLRITNGVNFGESYSQEFRLSSDGDGALDYQLGLYYYSNETGQGNGDPYVFVGEDFVPIASQQDLPFPLPVGLLVAPGDSITVDSQWENETLALFGQTSWYVNEQWQVTAGLRWTEEKKEADLYTRVDSTAFSAGLGLGSLLESFATPIDDQFKRDQSDVNWLFSTSYEIADDVMLFASAASGSKSGGFNGVSGASDEREFDDESSRNYELGLKSQWLDNSLRLNATLFLAEFEDYQTQEQLETGAGTRVGNEAEVETSGLDVHLDAVPLPNLTLSAGFQYLATAEFTAGNRKGQDLTGAPEFSGTVSATLVLPLADGGLYLRGDYSYMSDHRSNLNIPLEQDRETLNLRMGWRNDNWNTSLWVKNATDDVYSGYVADPLLFTGVEAYFLTPPRTWGATLRYEF